MCTTPKHTPTDNTAQLAYLEALALDAERSAERWPAFRCFWLRMAITWWRQVAFVTRQEQRRRDAQQQIAAITAWLEHGSSE